VRDCVRKGRQANYGTRPERLAKIPKGSSHYTAKLVEADVSEIRRLAASGIQLKTLASRFNVAASNISLIVSGKRWKHVDQEKGQAQWT
jgi:hypothetical protein